MVEEQEVNDSRKLLKQMYHSPVGKVIRKELDERIVDGWEKFIALPVDKKTSKASYDAQAKYKVLKDFREWLEYEVKAAE